VDRSFILSSRFRTGLSGVTNNEPGLGSSGIAITLYISPYVRHCEGVIYISLGVFDDVERFRVSQFQSDSVSVSTQQAQSSGIANNKPNSG
jgi:hypothetical protein